MATSIDDMTVQDELKWLRRQLYTISGGIKPNLDDHTKTKLLNRINVLNTKILLGMA